MPELPEVEYAARVLRRAIVGGTLRDVRILHDALRRRASPAALRRLRGRTVERVERRGKHQLIVLEGGVVLHVHFRMSGDWHVGREGDPLPAHARAAIALAEGTRVALVDPRALSTLAVHRADELTFDDLGPEATDPALDGRALGARLAKRRGAVKPALLDQRVVAGLGNIYAAEALWHARVSPLAPAGGLDARQLAAIVRGMRKALALADRDPGRYARGEATARLAVYGRAGEPCRRCGGPVARIVQAGRSTYFCPACQAA